MQHNKLGPKQNSRPIGERILIVLMIRQSVLRFRQTSQTKGKGRGWGPSQAGCVFFFVLFWMSLPRFVEAYWLAVIQTSSFCGVQIFLCKQAHFGLSRNSVGHLAKGRCHLTKRVSPFDLSDKIKWFYDFLRVFFALILNIYFYFYFGQDIKYFFK